MALNEIAFVVVITSLDKAFSTSVTCLMPMENSRPVTSTAVVNSARARKPENHNVTGAVAAKFVPVLSDSGIDKAKALFSALTKVKTDASKSNFMTTPCKGVVTPFAKTSTAMVVPCPETVPDVTPSSI